MGMTAWAQEQAAKHEAWSEIQQLKADNKALAEAVLTALRGTRLDKHGNRDDDGLLPFKETKTAIEALANVEALAIKAGE